MKLVEVARTHLIYNTYVSNRVKRVRQLIRNKLFEPGGNLHDNVYSMSPSPQSTFVVTECLDDDQIVGVCILDKLVGAATPTFDGNIFVSPMYRNQGVARELIRRTYKMVEIEFGKSTVLGNSTFVKLSQFIASPIKTKRS